jgi:hypothetical protein
MTILAIVLFGLLLFVDAQRRRALRQRDIMLDTARSALMRVAEPVHAVLEQATRGVRIDIAGEVPDRLAQNPQYLRSLARTGLQNLDALTDSNAATQQGGGAP